MNSADWNNIARCALERKAEHGNSIRWISRASYDRYYREYGTVIFAWARATRARRMGD